MILCAVFFLLAGQLTRSEEIPAKELGASEQNAVATGTPEAEVVAERQERLLWSPLSLTREGAQTPLAAMALSADPAARMRALEGVARVRGSEMVPFVIYSLADPNVEVRDRARQSLESLDDDAVTESVVAVLAWGEPQVVAGVDAALPSLGSTLEKGMLRMIDDARTTRDERVALAYALGRLGSRKAIEPLSALAMKDDALLSAYAANALTEIDDPGALHALMNLVHHTDPNVRLPAYYGIARIGGPEALGLLTAAASLNGEPDRRVRREVIRYLGLVGDESTVHFLIGLVRERSGFVQPAIDALELITGMQHGLEGERWLEWYDETFGNPNVQTATVAPPPLVPITDRRALQGTPIPGNPSITP